MLDKSKILQRGIHTKTFLEEYVLYFKDPIHFALITPD